MKRIVLATLIAMPFICAGPGYAAQTDFLTIDTHVDIPADFMGTPAHDPGNDSEMQVDLGKMERGGLDAAFFVVYVPQGPLTAKSRAKAVEQAAEKFEAIHRMVLEYPDRIRLATRPDQVVANHKAGYLSAMIGVENAYSLGHDLNRLDAMYALGARYIGLVHIGNNGLCSSSLPDTEHGEPAVAEHGITGFGRKVVERANRLGMMVDISHASDACVRDVLEISDAPIIASHSSSRALRDHPRNLSDDLIRAIAAKGGVIQAVALGSYVAALPKRRAAIRALRQRVAEKQEQDEFDRETMADLPAMKAGMKKINERYPLPSVDDFVDHIEHIVKVAGIDHVGIASDFNGGGGLRDWQNAAQTQNVTEALRRAGFSNKEIAKVWGGNLLRVWRTVERVAASKQRAAAPPVHEEIKTSAPLQGEGVCSIHAGLGRPVNLHYSWGIASDCGIRSKSGAGLERKA